MRKLLSVFVAVAILTAGLALTAYAEEKGPIVDKVYVNVKMKEEIGLKDTAEGLTEVGQQMMERAQAGLPIDTDDAIAEYREAAIAGGLIGGGTRATIGSFDERGPETPPPADITSNFYGSGINRCCPGLDCF